MRIQNRTFVCFSAQPVLSYFHEQTSTPVEIKQVTVSILVVQYNRVLAAEINDAIDELKKYRCHMSGCILNGVRSLPGSGRKIIGGYYGYGKYGKYGKYGNYG